MILDLQVETVFEDLLELAALRTRLVYLAVDHQVGERSLGTGGKGDQPLAVFFQQLHVHARLVVESLEIAGRSELHQVPVARGVLREHDEMGRLVGSCAAPDRTPLLAAARRQVQLATDDRLESRVLDRLVKLHGAEHVSMIGHGDGGHVVGFGGCCEIFNAAGAVEEAVVRMVVQMHERGHGAGPSVSFRGCLVQPGGILALRKLIGCGAGMRTTGTTKQK